MLPDFFENSPFLDYNSNIEATCHNLPHWNQDGKLQFITFRLADSLPQTAIAVLRRYKKFVERQNSYTWTESTKRKFNSKTMRKIDQWLDRGYGSCVLKNTEIRDIVIESFDYISNNGAIIPAYVIMPNHIHLLLLCSKGEKWTDVLGSMRQYTARRINKLIGKKGALWQKEPYDRIVRDLSHFGACLNYISENPRHLKSGDYHLNIDQTAIAHIKHMGD